MKALILAAGFGTRLLPFTQKVPKPLFTLSCKPILQITIEKLINAGFKDIFINTHYLSEKIQEFISTQNYAVNINTVYEPEILDTGGAISNLKDFLCDEKFLVINSDIITNIDLKKIYNYHQSNKWLATLVLHNYHEFNKVKTDDNNFIIDFNSTDANLAFTGIQVLSPGIFKHMPDQKKFSSIDLYKRLLEKKQIKSYISTNHHWTDIGTLHSYKKECLKHIALHVHNAFEDDYHKIQVKQIAGDGSDRLWFRSIKEKQSFVISDHDLYDTNKSFPAQIDSFINIGNHLKKKGLFVPKIICHDKFSGLVGLEDLGDKHLQNVINTLKSNEDIIDWYKKVIDSLIEFSQKGFEDFNLEWTYQTQEYCLDMILENECKYFMDAFINDYLKKDMPFEELLTEFEFIAQNALKYAVPGLMHRDMQSRNIMINCNQVYFIDFQGARKGPIQYDLASLLIDPYIALNKSIKKKLLKYACQKLEQNIKFNPAQFLHGFHYCCITRNLQFLGAFSFLSQVKKKKNFEKYIPYAVKSLKKVIESADINKIPRLYELIKSL